MRAKQLFPRSLALVVMALGIMCCSHTKGQVEDDFLPAAYQDSRDNLPECAIEIRAENGKKYDSVEYECPKEFDCVATNSRDKIGRVEIKGIAQQERDYPNSRGHEVWMRHLRYVEQENVVSCFPMPGKFVFLYEK